MKALPPDTYLLGPQPAVQETRERGGISRILGLFNPRATLCPVDNALSSISYACVHACVCVYLYKYLYKLPEYMEYNKVFIANPSAFSFFHGTHHTRSAAGG